LLWRVVVAGLLIGTLYGGIQYGSPATGGMVGAAMATGFFALERFVLRRNAGGLIRPLPFLAYFALRSILYVGVIVLAIVVVTELLFGRFAGIGGVDVLFSLSLVVGANLLFSVNDLLGPLSPPDATMSHASRSGRYCSSTCAPRQPSPSDWANSAI
jgi:hypothetical protein